ncbi:unnamed protein product, partial [Mesorhabditis spiculigera]
MEPVGIYWRPEGMSLHGTRLRIRGTCLLLRLFYFVTLYSVTAVRVQKVSPEQLHQLQAVLEGSAVEKVSQQQSDGIELFADVRRQPGAHPSHNELSVNEVSNYFQGDVDLSLTQYNAITNHLRRTGSRREKRKIGKSPFYNLWDRGKSISYDFAENVPRDTRAKIRDALRLWQRNTCIRFEENGPNIDRLEFFDGGGCSSFVGKVGGTQGISIATPGCDAVGIISHEIGHSLGNFHEQARPDQEQHISVNWNNIPLGRWNNFNAVGDAQADTYGLPYDTGSVMHYGPFGFATDPYVPTIRTIERSQQTTIGQRAGPSFLDYQAINLAYGCYKNCPPIRCHRGGYPHPNNCSTCMCPEGLAGDHCDFVRASNQECGGVIWVSEQGFYINSPYYPRHFPKGSECYWLLRSVNGAPLSLKFDGKFDFYCEDTCDKSVAPRRTFVSKTHEMLVIMKGSAGGSQGFQAFVQARAVGTPTTPRPVNLRKVVTTTASPTEVATAAECNCGEWSEWIGECSQVCGGCGSRQRTRQCAKEDCHDVDKRPCNFKACPEGTNFLINNGEFHILWRGCCVGMIRSQTECTALASGENPLFSIITSLLSSSDQKKAERTNTIQGEHGGSLPGDGKGQRVWKDY